MAGLVFKVKRVGAARSSASGVKDEVLVIFESVRERDKVRAYAKNLERRGKGLCLEVPDHLWPNFWVLQNTGYELKRRNPSLKRNIFFDDAADNLKMDIFLKEKWKTILPDGARQSLSKLGRCGDNTSRGTISAGDLTASSRLAHPTTWTTPRNFDLPGL